ncbi:hypothetical protein PM082_023488 [Marasmius tenuissimus]|nr:hypothetical protein PM082_023488 [Marasmius tenuissimus]
MCYNVKNQCLNEKIIQVEDTKGVNIVDARANAVGIAAALEGIDELQVSLGGFDGDNISIETLKLREDVVEVGVAEVRVGLGLVLDTSGGAEVALELKLRP